MHHKLLRQARIDELKHEVAGAQQAVGGEVSLRRSKNERKHRILAHKGDNGKQHHRCECAQERAAQFFKVFPERQGVSTVTSFSASSAFFSPLPSMPSLNSLTPRPRPRISSGIFFPPKSSSTMSAITRISCRCNPNIIVLLFVVIGCEDKKRLAYCKKSITFAAEKTKKQHI